MTRSTRTVRAHRFVKPHLLALAVAAALTHPAASAAAFFWTTGDFVFGVTAPEPLLLGDTLFIQAGGTKRFVGGLFTNQGLVRWQADALQGGNSGSVINSGIWQSESDANALTHNFGVQPTFFNTGTFRKSAGVTTNVGSWRFQNDGGLIDAQVGDIVFNGGTNIFNAGSRFTGAGQVRLAAGSSFTGNFQADNLHLTAGSHNGNGASLTGGAGLSSGLVGWSGGDLTGNWTFAAGSTVTAASGGTKRQVGSSIVNNGTFRWATTDTLQGGNSSAFANNGLLEVTESALFQHNFGGRPSYTNNGSGTVRATNNATFTLGSVGLTSNGGTFEAHAGSAIIYAGSTNRFNGGTRFIGDNAVTGSARFVDVIQSDSLRFVSGSQAGGDGNPGSRGRLAGQVGYEGGDLTGAWEIQSGATMTASGATTKRQVGSDIVNNGSFRWSTTAMLQGGNSSVFTNNGLLEVTQSALFQHIFGGQPSYTNNGSGTVRATNNATFTLGSVGLTSNGGTFEAHAGSAIIYAGSTNRFNGGTRFIGDNAVTGSARFVDVIQSDSLRFVSGSQAGGDGNPGSRGRLAGQVGYEGGDLTGAWEIRSGATMTASGATTKRQVGSDIVNNGRFVWTNATTLQGGNSSVFTNNGRFEFRGDGSMTHNFGGAPRLDNNGLLAKTGGAGVSSLAGVILSNAGTMDVRSGAIALPTNFVNAGTLMGTGAFNVAGTLTNNGHVAPGASPGTLTINGNYLQSALGTLDTELENLSAFDLLVINGNASLNGTLALSCFSLCDFQIGDEVVILDATGQLSGTFASVTLSGFGSGAFDVIYDTVADRVLLRITENVTPQVPEPETYALMLGGLGLVAWMARRRRRQG